MNHRAWLYVALQLKVKNSCMLGSSLPTELRPQSSRADCLRLPLTTVLTVPYTESQWLRTKKRESSFFIITKTP